MPIRPPVAVALMLAVAGCALPDLAPPPESVRISTAGLAVRFTDGVTCRAPLGPGGGEGPLEGCPHPARYVVRIEGQNPLRQLLGDAVEPYARITVTPKGGVRRDYVTPGARDAWRRDAAGR